MGSPIRFGLFDQSEQPGNLATADLYRSRLEIAELAEQIGFWGYHKSEHHLTPLDHAPSIGLFLASLAQRTKNLRLCSLCHLLPFYHPLRLYEEICMLDHLSNGRFELGFGKGISAPEHMLWGMAADEAIRRTDEVLELLLSAFQCDGSFSFNGRFYQFKDVPLQLKPLQRPYPPLWRPGTLQAAASLGVSTIAGGPSDRVVESVRQFREIVQSGISGGHPARVGAIRRFIVAPTDAQAQAIGERAWVRFSANLGQLFNQYKLPIPNDPTIGGDFERAQAVQAVVVGSPSRIKDHIAELTNSGDVDYVVGCFAFGDISHDEAIRSLSLFGEHVVN
ncbi:MAG: LLM class flavin-dependent oxidoreductase [Burkholderiaceae bacterium]